jgi:hypothetical protein
METTMHLYLEVVAKPTHSGECSDTAPCRIVRQNEKDEGFASASLDLEMMPSSYWPNMNIRHGLILISTFVVLGLGWLGWWVFGRSAEEQLAARQATFLTALEERDWGQVKSMLTPDYLDDYGHNRDSAVEDAKQVLGSFFTLTIKPEVVQKQVLPDLAVVKLKIRIEGKGLGLSEAVISQVNSLEKPWYFHWHKKGRWPWDWKVVQIHHDQSGLTHQSDNSF